jgi:hypothetical protein
MGWRDEWEAEMYGRERCMGGRDVWKAERERCMGGRDVWEAEMNGMERCMGGSDEWEGEMYGERER